MKSHTNIGKLGLFGTYMLIRFALLVPITTAAFKTKSFKQVLQKQPKHQFGRWTASSKNNTRILSVCSRTIALIERHSPYPGTCLSRSLVLWSTLHRYGIDSEIRIGIKHDKPAEDHINGNPIPSAVSFTAHAWVEVNGKPLNAPYNISAMYTPFSDQFMTEKIDKLLFI